MELYKEIEKTFPKIKALFSDEKLVEFLRASPECLGEYNFGLGTMIRLKLLRPKGVLYRLFIQNGFVDKDEMALEIIRRFHQSIRL